MKKILLVKLPELIKKGQLPTYVPPIGLWSIAHNLRRWYRGIFVHVIDCHLDGGGLDLLKTHARRNWDAIGISVQFSIQHQNYLDAVALCNTPVFAGGFHAAAVPAPKGVTVFRGAGELALNPFARAEDVEYPVPDEASMIPYWQARAPHDLQSTSRRWMPIEFSRGCNNRCGFCGVNGFWGKTQYFELEKIDDYLCRLAEIGIKELFIEDDNFVEVPWMFEQILARLRHLHFSWSMPNGIRIRGIMPYLHQLKGAGCWRVSLPFETGTRKSARLMRLGNKWLEWEEALAVVQTLKDEGIQTCGFFIIGYPGETLADMRETLDYANALPLDQRNIYIATPYPGSPLYDACVENGYLVSEPPQLYEDLLYTRGLIRTEDFTPEQVEDLKRRDRDAAIARKEEVASCPS